MPFISRWIKPVMIISGALTLTMIYAVIAPQAALSGLFGETLSGPLAEIIVRNWGALIAIGGAMLVWGAFHPEVRSLVLLAVGGQQTGVHRIGSAPWPGLSVRSGGMGNRD